jgi:hypothetical protein
MSAKKTFSRQYSSALEKIDAPKNVSSGDIKKMKR